MAVILLDIEGQDNSAGALDRATRGLTTLDQTLVRLAGSSATVQRAIDAQASSYLRLESGAMRAHSALDTLARGFAGATAAADTYRSTIDGLDAANSAAARSSDQIAIGLDAIRLSANAATRAIADQIAAMTALSRVSLAGGAAGGAGNTLGGAAVRAAASRSAFSRAAGVAQVGIAESAGLGGRITPAAFGPEGLVAGGLVAGGLLYGGYKAAQASNQFYSGISQLAAQTNNPYGALAPVSQSALGVGATGTSQYSPNQVAQGGQQFLAAQVPASTYAQVAPYIAQGSAVIKQPDLNLLATATTDLADSFGKGKDTSVQAFKAFADMAVAADQFAKANPGALVANMAKILPVARIAGVSAPEALAYTIKETLSGESTRFSATNFAALISNVSLRGTPTPAQQRAALGLGVEIGPKAIQDYGGFTNWLQAVFKGAKTDPNASADLYALSGTRNAFRGLAELSQGAGTAQFKDITRTLANSSGTIPRNFSQLVQNSPDAQWKGAENQFQTALINTGKVLTDTFQPALLSLALGALGAAKNLGDIAGKGGSWLDDAAKWMRGGNGAGVDLNNVTGSDFSRAANWLTHGALGGGTAAPAGMPTPAGGTAPPPGAPGGMDRYYGGFYDAYAKRHHLTAAQQGGAPPPVPGTLAWDAVVTAPPGANTPQERQDQFNPGRHLLAFQAEGARRESAAFAQTMASQSAAYRSLGPDAAAAAKAHDDLVNKLSAGLPIDNVVRQLGVYDAALGKLRTDLGNLPPGMTIPGISTKTIGAEETTAGRAVGQYGYISAKTTFDQARQEYLAGQISKGQFTQAEQGALKAVPGSGKSGPAADYLAYSIKSQFDKAVGSVTRADTAASDNLTLAAAQQNYQAAQLMSNVPGDWKASADAYFAALRQFDKDTLTGRKLDTALAGVNQQQAVYTKKATDYAVQTGDRALSNQEQIDTIHGNLAAAAKDRAARLAYDTANAKQLGKSPSDLALEAAQNWQANQATLLKPPTPFHANQQGLGAFGAGDMSTLVRLGGGKDPQAETIKHLQAMLAKDDEEIALLRALVAQGKGGNTARSTGMMTQRGHQR